MWSESIPPLWTEVILTVRLPTLCWKLLPGHTVSIPMKTPTLRQSNRYGKFSTQIFHRPASFHSYVWSPPPKEISELTFFNKFLLSTISHLRLDLRFQIFQTQASSSSCDSLIRDAQIIPQRMTKKGEIDVITSNPMVFLDLPRLVGLKFHGFWGHDHCHQDPGNSDNTYCIMCVVWW